MKYLSVCSGIEAATVAWHHMGWTPVGFSEIEPFPSAVLQHHYPDVPNLGDMTNYKEWNIEQPDILVGGTPCQSFSVAGLRKGLEDPRGNLALVYCGLLDHFRPRWFVWENVPGVLSSNGGRDFGAFIGAVAELGYGFAYRVLDAQFFGVPQRRRRVFVVGHLGDWRAAAAVLFERQSLSGHPAPSRETRKETTGSTGDGIARCITAGEMKRQDWETCNFVADQRSYGIQGNMIGRSDTAGPQGSGISEDVSFTLTKGDRHGVAFAENSRVEVRYEGGDGERTGALSTGGGKPGQGVPMVLQPKGVFQDSQFGVQQYDSAGTLRSGRIPEHQMVLQPIDFRNLRYHEGEVAGTMQSKSTGGYSLNYETGIQQNMAVRRLTPIECERLQKFPDNYTNISWRKQPESPDGPRYKALGNSMAVPVMRWIGERIQAVSALI